MMGNYANCFVRFIFFSFALPRSPLSYAVIQARTQQLLQQNRELLEHLASLGGYTYTENERAGLTSANISLAPQVA